MTWIIEFGWLDYSQDHRGLTAGFHGRDEASTGLCLNVLENFPEEAVLMLNIKKFKPRTRRYRAQYPKPTSTSLLRWA